MFSIISHQGNEATVKCLIPSTRMVTIKKGQVIKSVDKDIEKVEPSYAGGWTVSYLGKHSGTSPMVKHRITNSTLRNPREMKIYVHIKACIAMFIIYFIIPKWRQPKCPSLLNG